MYTDCRETLLQYPAESFFTRTSSFHTPSRARYAHHLVLSGLRSSPSGCILATFALVLLFNRMQGGRAKLISQRGPSGHSIWRCGGVFETRFQRARDQDDHEFGGEHAREARSAACEGSLGRVRELLQAPHLVESAQRETVKCRFVSILATDRSNTLWTAHKHCWKFSKFLFASGWSRDSLQRPDYRQWKVWAETQVLVLAGKSSFIISLAKSSKAY